MASGTLARWLKRQSSLERGAKGGVGIDHSAESGSTDPISLSPEGKETGLGLARTGVKQSGQRHQ